MYWKYALHQFFFQYESILFKHHFIGLKISLSLSILVYCMINTLSCQDSPIIRTFVSFQYALVII